ncbi:MAG: cation:proton antiporter [Thermoplasmata archaeon]
MNTETITAFLAIGAIIFLGFFGNAIFTKFRIPDVLILILLGVVIGPDILGERFNLVTYEALAAIDNFKEIFLSAALVIILFDAGLSLDIRSVLESMRLTALMSVSAFLGTFISVGVVLHLIMEMDLLLSLTLGAIIGGTSGAIVIPIVSKMRIRPQTKAMLITESIVTDVLVIVVSLTMLTVIMTGELNLTSVTVDLTSKFLVGAVVGFLVGVGWLFVLQRMHNQPLCYMITLAALLVVAGVVELPPISSSGAVAALTFGLAIGNKQFIKRRLTSLSLNSFSNLQIQQFHTEITFFVRTFFFVYLGLFFRFSTFTEVHLVTGLLIISMIVLIRWITSMAAWKLGDLDIEDAETVFASMPRGLAAAVLATLPAVMLAGYTSIWSEGLGALFLNTTLIVILGTTGIATVLSFVTEKGIDRRQRLALRRRLTQE